MGGEEIYRQNIHKDEALFRLLRRMVYGIN